MPHGSIAPTFTTGMLVVCTDSWARLNSKMTHLQVTKWKCSTATNKGKI